MKDKVMSILFVGILFVTSVCFIVFKDNDLSFYERRKLVTSDSVKEDFFGNLDSYMSDQFPFRDELISLDSVVSRYLLLNKEKNDVYVLGDYLIEKNYPYKEKEVSSFISKINYIKDKYLKDNNVFISVIPDKSYYLNDDYLKLDFDKVINELEKNIDIPYIDIMDSFVLEDYYKTDIHLKQDSYFKVMKKFDDYLNFNYESLEYSKKTYDSFYGASVGKVGSYVKSEELEYYVNDVILNSNVKHLEYGEKSVYDLSKLNEVDVYNLFLSGPSALIEIDNDNSLSDKELVIFRDSFGSSFAPLLIPYYKKIILVDLRYINMDSVSNYIDFDNKDVLFLYSTLIINSSNILKVMF